MKQLLFLGIIVLFSTSYCQKIDDREITFPHIQLPMVKLPKEVTTFSVSINTPSTAGTYTSRIETSVGRLKPTGKNGSNMSNIPCVITRWEDCTELYKTTYMNIEGLKRVPKDQADLHIELTFGFLEILVKEEKDREVTLFAGTQDEHKVHEEGYFTQSVCPSNLKITTRQSVILYDKPIRERSNNYSLMIWNRDYFCIENLNGDKKEEVILDHINNDVFPKVAKILGDMATKKTSRNVSIFIPSYKSYDYTDITTANNLILEASFYIEKDKTGSIKKIQDAITIYEKALSEENVTDNKVRINKKVAESLHANLLAAYWIAGRYEQAQGQLSFLQDATKVKKVAKEWKNLLADDIIRAKINQ